MLVRKGSPVCVFVVRAKVRFRVQGWSLTTAERLHGTHAPSTGTHCQVVVSSKGRVGKGPIIHTKTAIVRIGGYG